MGFARCIVVFGLLAIMSGQPASAQGPRKASTPAEDLQSLLGEWQMEVVKDGETTLTKIRITDRYLRMFIRWQTPATFQIGGSQFEYRLVEKEGKRALVIYGATRDQASGMVTYQLDGDKLRLTGGGVALNNREYDLTGEWTRLKKKKGSVSGKP